MEARVKLMGHPVHQMLIVFPLGLLGMSVVFDLIFLSTESQIFSAVAYWMMVAGVASGLLAAPFGFLDWRGIPAGTRAKRIGAMHGIGNVIVVLLFIGSLVLRADDGAIPPASAYVCSFLGVGLSLVTAWLGGELVDRLGIGVHDNANPDAPSSLHKAHRMT
jgi:uncharacterized membrane protein